VFIDESVEVKVTVDGEEYEAIATVDANHDGQNDSATVSTDDGSIMFTDLDGDGQADLMTQYNLDGDVIGQASFDAETGEWVHQETDPGSLVVDLPGGGHADLGPATHDTDNDGVNDTLVTTDAAGNTILVTDVDEDGTADQLTEITSKGGVTVAKHTTDSDWTIVEQGELDEHGQYHRDAAAAEESGWLDAPAPRADDQTGHWADR
jgi:hypothetical protein